MRALLIRVGVCLVCVVAATALGQDKGADSTGQLIERKYDRFKDETTVKLKPQRVLDSRSPRHGQAPLLSRTVSRPWSLSCCRWAITISHSPSRHHCSNGLQSFVEVHSDRSIVVAANSAARGGADVQGWNEESQKLRMSQNWYA